MSEKNLTADLCFQLQLSQNSCRSLQGSSFSLCNCCSKAYLIVYNINNAINKAIGNIGCLKNKKKMLKTNCYFFVCKCILLDLVFQYKLSMALNYNLKAGGR